MSNSIRDARVRSGLSVTELARRCGVSRQAARAWDFGSSWPKPDMLLKVAAVLQVPVDEIATRDSVRPARDDKAALPKTETGDLEATFAECKALIAARLGIDPARVELKVSLVSG